MTCPPARHVVAALWIALGAAPVLAQSPAATPDAPRDTARIFFFGNSLVHHLTDSDQTTVPHWMALMARQDRRDFGADGRWGFPRNFATELPPQVNWQFAEVETVWNPYGEPFGAAGFDTIIFNPENYIQYDRADRPYNGDNPDRATPLGATLTVMDWVADNANVPQFLIYEGWADLHPFAREFPPTAREMTQYYDHAQGTYARWYDDYVARLAALRPEAGVRLIPVGRVMAEVLTEAPLSQIPAEALYSDLSPHGTETVYLLAAMITYAAIYGAPPPAGMDLPDTIDPTFAAAYDQTAARIWQILQSDAP